MKVSSLNPNKKLTFANSKNKQNHEISFKEFLNNSIKKVNQLQQDSQKLSEMLAVGKIDNLHKAMISVEKASLALQLTIQIRNKLLDAYNELMRMQI
ncbi:MAG: flagellar hook-basal body complex protein FliE [Thermosediminibacterales bacterium]|nr:flagellar hook-basal body complex protein FliE [Thermosediminibacterales bacterium]